MKVASPPAARTRSDGLRAGRLAVLGDDDLGALGREHLGRHPAHPAAAAGDDRDLALESHRFPSRTSVGGQSSARPTAAHRARSRRRRSAAVGRRVGRCDPEGRPDGDRTGHDHRRHDRRRGPGGGARRRGPGAGVRARSRWRVGADAVALPVRSRHDGRAPGRRSRARRLRGDGARLHRPAARAPRRGPDAEPSRGRPTGSPRSISPPSSARPRRPGRSSTPGPWSTPCRATRCASSRSTARPRAATTRCAGCSSRPGPT